MSSQRRQLSFLESVTELAMESLNIYWSYLHNNPQQAYYAK